MDSTLQIIIPIQRSLFTRGESRTSERPWPQVDGSPDGTPMAGDEVQGSMVLGTGPWVPSRLTSLPAQVYVPACPGVPSEPSMPSISSIPSVPRKAPGQLLPPPRLSTYTPRLVMAEPGLCQCGFTGYPHLRYALFAKKSWLVWIPLFILVPFLSSNTHTRG